MYENNTDTRFLHEYDYDKHRNLFLLLSNVWTMSIEWYLTLPIFQQYCVINLNKLARYY